MSLVALLPTGSACERVFIESTSASRGERLAIWSRIVKMVCTRSGGAIASRAAMGAINERKKGRSRRVGKVRVPGRDRLV